MKITLLTYKWYKQQKSKNYDLNIFKKLSKQNAKISIHEVINQNIGFKYINHNDTELLKMARKRQSIKAYLENDFFKPPFTEQRKKYRRFCNFRKWLKKLNSID